MEQSSYYYILASCCTVFSMGFAGYVTVCVQLYCISFHCERALTAIGVQFCNPVE
jgi:hypothetical protein